MEIRSDNIGLLSNKRVAKVRKRRSVERKFPAFPSLAASNIGSLLLFTPFALFSFFFFFSFVLSLVAILSLINSALYYNCHDRIVRSPFEFFHFVSFRLSRSSRSKLVQSCCNLHLSCNV